MKAYGPNPLSQSAIFNVTSPYFISHFRLLNLKMKGSANGIFKRTLANTCMKLKIISNRNLPACCMALSLVFIWVSFCHSTAAQNPGSIQSLAIGGAKIYPSPTESPILDGIVLISEEKIIYQSGVEK